MQRKPTAKLQSWLVLAAAATVIIFAGWAPSALARDYYGAIAVSPATLKYGWAANKNTQADAQAEAIKVCGVNDCKADTFYWNGCGGLAFGDGNAWGSHWAGDRDSARTAAIKACADFGQNCRVERVTCSLGEADAQSSQCTEAASTECSAQCRSDVICQSACVRRRIEQCN